LRSVSQVVAALILVAVAVAVSVAGFFIISSMAQRVSDPSYQVSVSYSKLTFITDSEYVSGTRYVTYRLELGTISTAPSRSLRVVITYISSTGDTKYIDTGVNVPVPYGSSSTSAVVRVRYQDIQNMGCTDYYSVRMCPSLRGWVIALCDQNTCYATSKPVYIAP